MATQIARTVSCPPAWTSLEDIPPRPSFDDLTRSGLPLFEEFGQDYDLVQQENDLRAFIRWETELLEMCEVVCSWHDAWLEFEAECDAEYQTRLKKEAWTDVKRKVRTSKKVPQDINLVCRDCAHDFVFTVMEQKKFEKRGWVQPKTCKLCIEHRR